MKEKPDVEKQSFAPFGQINSPITGILAPLLRLSGETGQNQARRTGTKSSGSGKPAVASGK